MSKKLICSLIASLFAAPAFAQSDTDPMRVEGTATAGGIYNNTKAPDKAQLNLYQDLNSGALSNIGARGRNSTTSGGLGLSSARTGESSSPYGTN